jgi:DNA invertase Pin-like site-specific DNA recombinase
MKPKAYPYFRYSTIIQKDGDSERRQEEKAKQFAKHHHLDFDDSLKLHDFGVSAYRGDNLNSGKLSDFIALVEDGTIAKGSHLIIENFDRFSRQEPRKALKPFLNLIDLGINIAVVDDNVIHTDTSDSSGLMLTIMYMDRAHKESKTKGRRVQASKNQAKQKLLDGTRKTLWKWGTPKWLNWSPTRYTVNYERVEVIKKILAWVIEGRGTSWIVEQLADVPPWGSGSGIKLPASKQPKQWHFSQITRIVNNRALFGERQLMVKDDDGNQSVEFIPDYFPAVVTEEYFYQVQAARRSRDLSYDSNGIRKGGGGRKGKTVSNLFQKLAMCGYSIEGNASKFKCPDNNRYMVYANKDRRDQKTGKKNYSRYLQCMASKESGSPCTSCRKMYPYAKFETAFLTHVQGVSVETIFGTDITTKSKVSEINAQIETLSNQLDDANRQVVKLEKAIEESTVISNTLLKQLNKYETLQSTIPKQIEQNKSKRRVLHSQHENGEKSKHQLVDLIQLMSKCEDDKQLYDLRLKISELLKSMIERIEVYNRGTFIDENTTAQKIERMREKAAEHPELEDIINVIRASDEQSAGDGTPYFVVHYKSGERQFIQANPKDPTDLLFNMKFDDDGLIERPFMKGHE